MSTRCQIEFRRGEVRRTIYRHWDGYPSSVMPHLLEFLAWSTRGDIEEEAANFLFWSKQGLDNRSVQLGFGICANDELHGDIDYYVVEHLSAGTVVRAHAVEYDRGGPRIGRQLQEVAAPQSLFSFSFLPKSMVQALPRVEINDIEYFRDNRLHAFSPVRQPAPAEQLQADHVTTSQGRKRKHL